MSDIERACENCRHEHESMEGEHCRNCIRNATDNFEPKEVCKWEYDEFEEKWQTDCGVLFTVHDNDKEIMHFCPCCGKEIKVV